MQPKDALVWFEKMKENNIKPSVMTYNTIIDMFGKTQSPNEAIRIYHSMAESGVLPNVRHVY